MNKNSSEKSNDISLNTSVFKQIVSSGAGAVITSLLMTPLDVVKIRLQSQSRLMHKGDCFVYRNGLMDHLCTCFNGPESWYNRRIPGGRYTGTMDALVKIVRFEGVSSLWSGLPPTLLMAMPQVVLYFSTYEEIKRLWGYHSINNPDPWMPPLAGGFARLIAVTAVSPVELVRTKIQSERLNYPQLFKGVKLEIKNNGLMSLYKGWAPTVLRDVPFSMIYWFNYEFFKRYLLDIQKRSNLDIFSTFICGASAGSIAAAITCPFDVVKTQRQIQLGETKSNNKKSVKTIQIIIEIYRKSGPGALFSGLVPRVTKVALSCAIMITSFEYFKTLFEKESRINSKHL